MTALIVTEECGAETIVVTITKKNATYIFRLLILPSSYFPADIPLNMLNHHRKTTQVRTNLPHFLGLHLLIPFFRRQLSHCAMPGKLGINSQHQPCLLNEFDTTFPTSTCQRVISSEWLIQTVCHGEGPKGFPKLLWRSASVKIASSSESLVSFW